MSIVSDKDRTDAIGEQQSPKGGFVKSPINYTGGKHKLMPKLYQLMPKDVEGGTFVDLFGGGGTVVANAPDCFTHLVYNELDDKVASLVDMLATTDGAEIESHVLSRMDEYGLDRQNKDAYLRFRSDYNDTDPAKRDPRDLFALIAHSFSNQIRFNSKGGFNIPFGKRTFNEKMIENMHAFTGALSGRDFKLCNASFSDFDFSALAPDRTFVYCDPPYLGSVATYNERDGWTEDDERALLSLLDGLDDAGFRWMLSNNFEYDNPLLKTWAGSREGYTVVDLDYDYNSCNYHKNRAKGDAGDGAAGNSSGITEVAIINYGI